jgi:cation diffusion facilitator CzcD-associated flavoprotein CzcO
MAALKTLLDEEFSVDCFEKSDRVGGHWHTDYEALHLITPRDSSAFEGFPMPADYPVYPSRDQVRDYMLAYAAAFDLHRHIHLNTAVEHCVPPGQNGEAGWRVTLSTGESRTYKAVLVANGHLWDPAFPEAASDYTGTSLHPCQYVSTDEIKGCVLVVGCGNSGCDLAVNAPQHRLDVSIAVRRGQVFQPKTLLGKPRSELPFLQGLSPELQNMVTNMLILASKGTAADYPGLPTPETYDLDQHPPVLNDLLLYWIQHGRMKVVPGIERIEGRTVHFTDGRAEDFDTILWATGFSTRLPFLEDDLLEWRDGVPLRTAATVRESDNPETRIDIVKREWLADLDRTWDRLRFVRPARSDAAKAA